MERLGEVLNRLLPKVQGAMEAQRKAPEMATTPGPSTSKTSEE